MCFENFSLFVIFLTITQHEAYMYSARIHNNTFTYVEVNNKVQKEIHITQQKYAVLRTYCLAQTSLNELVHPIIILPIKQAALIISISSYIIQQQIRDERHFDVVTTAHNFDQDLLKNIYYRGITYKFTLELNTV